MQNKVAEKEFFDATAAMYEANVGHTVWDYGLILKTLDISNNLNGAKWLEAGCGAGEWGVQLSKRNAKVLGIDISDKTIELNRNINKDVKDYSCIVGDLENIASFAENSFDAITCFGVLHHFPDPKIIINNFRVWLKDGGIVCAVEPNGGNMTTIATNRVKRLLPGSLAHRMGLSSINEDIVHTMDDYYKLFTKRGFTCDLKTSLNSTEIAAIENCRGITKGILLARTLLDMVKGLLYKKNDICFGDMLAFRMSVNKLKPSKNNENS
ncbi:MAG: class I SAM-dependent methyltransferase [Nitrospirae bacterium]|nr:class I SAM-dependent methyltransferase [Nitrospirota bacterium]